MRTRTMPIDPTAFRPMKITASRETKVGFELEPITKQITADKARIWIGGWPKTKGFHDDYAAAQKSGFPGPVIAGPQLVWHMEELVIKFFGKGYFSGGKLSIAIFTSVIAEDVITAKGVVTEKVAEGDAVRLLLDVWCENQRGEKVLAGTASGLVH